VSAVLRLYTRLTRRGVLLLALGLAAYALVEVISYVQTYPDQASRLRLAEFGDQPAVRMLQGIPHAVETVGGFTVWDGGWFMQSIIGVWAILVTSRLLRGEEDTGRAELVGAGPVPAPQVTNAGLMIVLAGCAAAGLSAFAALVVPGDDLLGAVLFGLGLAGFGAVMAAATAVASQLVAVRRHAAGIGAAFLGVAFVLRMIANSSDDRLWVGWLSAYGWMDRLRPFGDNNVGVIVIYVGVTAALVATAVALRARRDLGSALLAREGDVRSRSLLLRTPIRFAWRLTWGVLLAWLVGTALYSFFMGSLMKAMGQVLADDPAYKQYLDLLGLTKEDVTIGMVAFMSVVVSLVISLYAAWRIGAVRAEEDAERAEHLLTRPLTRGRWLGGHLLLAVVSVVVLVVANGLATWFGGAVTDAGVSVGDAVAAAANGLPVILLFGGLAVAMFGLAPRLTIAVPVGGVVVAYVLSFIGPALDFPGWVTGFSPFYHLALVPVQDYALTQGLVMSALAVAATGVGWYAFGRRDLVGA
jgi:polyether ionophore transport system permease protein